MFDALFLVLIKKEQHNLSNHHHKKRHPNLFEKAPGSVRWGGAQACTAEAWGGEKIAISGW